MSLQYQELVRISSRNYLDAKYCNNFVLAADYSVILQELDTVAAAVAAKEDFVNFVEKNGKPCPYPGRTQVL